MADRDADASEACEAPLVDRQAATLDRQEAVIDEQATLIADLRERNDRLRRRLAASNGVAVDRRSVLKAGGALGLLGIGVGTASAQSADPSGQVGTQDRPLETLYTAGMAGPVTADQRLTDLIGPGLMIDDGQLSLSDVAQGATLIEDWYGFEAMRDDPTGSYVLVADLDEDTNGYEMVAGPNANGNLGFEPIGTSTDAFGGSFDGNGHAITGLTINRGSEDHVGLFGYTDSEVTLANVVLETVDVSGANHTGALVGRNEGTVSGSHATGEVLGTDYVGGLAGSTAGTLRESHATASVVGGDYLGGFVGRNEGAVNGSYGTGDINGQLYVGGFVGSNVEGTISESSASGMAIGTGTAGGFVGRNDASIEQSDAAGDVIGGEYTGAFAGRNEGTIQESNGTGDVIGSG